MAENVGGIFYEVSAETSDLVNSSKAADASLDKLDRRFGQTDKAAAKSEMRMKRTSAAIQGLGRSASTATSALRGLMPVLGAAYLVKLAGDIIRTADAWTELQNRLQLVTGSQRELEQATNDVFRIAQTTSQEIDSVAQVYQRFAQNADALGISLDEAASLTETVSKAVAVSGASAGAAEASLTQFGQALASGTLRGDELNSILEQTPGLANAIAEGLGVSVGALRQLGADGKITTDSLIRALKNVSDSVDTQFNTRVKTAGQAMTELRNSVTRFIGEANESSAITTSLAASIERVSEAIDNVDVDALAQEIESIKATIALVTDGIDAIFNTLETGSETTANVVGRSFSDMALTTAKEVDGIAKVFQGTAGAIGAVWEALANNIPAYFNNAWIEVKQGAASFVNELADLINAPLQALGREGIGHVSFGGDGAIQAVRSLTEAARDGWNEAAVGVGAYERTLKRMTDNAIQSSIAEWQSEYTGEVKKTGEAAEASAASTGKLSAAQKQAAKDAQANANVIASLREQLMLAALSGERLAAAKEKLKLNPAATPAEVAEVEKLAAALYKVEQLKALQTKVGDDPHAYVRGDMQPLSGGAFDEQAARYEAEAVAEQERYAAQLVRLQEALEAQKYTQQEYYAEFESLAQTHADRMAQIDSAKAQVMLSSASDAFGSLAAVMKNAQGEQSGIYKALFAASKAFAIAESIIKIQQGIANAAALPFPANIPAMASVAAATAGIVSTISSTNMSGGRQYGGPVAGAGMYRINETGKPEVLNMANGQQFLLPNARGEVVSHKDATQGSGQPGNVTINVIESQERAGEVERTTDDQDEIISVFVADIRGGGRGARALEQTYGMSRRGS